MRGSETYRFRLPLLLALPMLALGLRASTAEAQVRLPPPQATTSWAAPPTVPPPVAHSNLPSPPPGTDQGVGPVDPYASYSQAISALQQPLPDSVENQYPDTGEEAQNAPGSMYGASDTTSETSSLPSYYYQYWYYNTWDVGARPIADYAPPGYMPRDYQDSPAVPEYSRITPPPLPAPGDSGNLVTRGMFPGSFLVPGTNTSFRLRGFVRLAALGDFEPIGVADAFVTNSIPVPQQIGQNTNFSARISRFALESWTPTEFLDWNVHTFIEGDFFNGAPQAAGGGGNPFRLRHAFFDFGYFRFGQQNSVFMDPTNWPSLVDFQGPNSWVNQRQPSARITLPVVNGVYWAASLERPFSDVRTNGLGEAVQRLPDFATHFRLETDVGHLQVAGLLRSIGYRPTGEEVTQRVGAAISGSATVHPWAILLGTDPVHKENPSGLTRSRILFMTTWGPGVGRYINDLAGQNFDGQVDPITGEFNLVNSFGWNVSYENWFNDKWLSNFTFSNGIVDNNTGQPGAVYDQAKYAAASLWWIPVARLSFGIEYLWGERENLNEQSADAQRLHGLAQYNF